MTGVPTFNLWDEPWIRCRVADGDVVELSLMQALQDARSLRGLGGELPTQDVAVLRIMLAVLYRTVPWGEGVTEQEAAIEGWAAVWRAGNLPMDRIHAYADEWRPRFDLLHPRAPFMQVADLATATGRTSGLGKLIGEVPDGHQFFTTRTAESANRIPFAEAARWLVHCQAYDVSGIKSGAVGDDRVSGGRGYPIGTGLCGRLGVFVLEGVSLFETLLLNLDLRLASGPESGGDADAPLWERVPLGAGVENRDASGPTGPADLATWPARRIRMMHDGISVVDALVANGDRPELNNLHRLEPMSAWTRPKPDGPTFPRGHQPDRSVWRGLESTLRADLGTTEKGAVPPMRVQEWINLLIDKRVLDGSRFVDWRAVGASFDTNYSVVVGAVDDSLNMPLVVVENPALVAAVHEAVGVTAGAVGAVGQLASNLARSGGGELADRGPAREHAYSLIDPHFRRWLSSLDPTTDLDGQRAAWQRTLHHELVTLGSVMVLHAGGRAAQGSLVADSPGGAPRFIDSGLAEKWFRTQLAKAIPLISSERRGPLSPAQPKEGSQP